MQRDFENAKKRFASAQTSANDRAIKLMAEGLHDLAIATQQAIDGLLIEIEQVNETLRRR